MTGLKVRSVCGSPNATYMYQTILRLGRRGTDDDGTVTHNANYKLLYKRSATVLMELRNMVLLSSVAQLSAHHVTYSDSPFPLPSHSLFHE